MRQLSFSLRFIAFVALLLSGIESAKATEPDTASVLVYNDGIVYLFSFTGMGHNAVAVNAYVYSYYENICVANIQPTITYEYTWDEKINGQNVTYTRYLTAPVTFIGDEAFHECESLTGVSIPNSIESIGVEAFVLCTSLTSVTFGNSVTSIGDGAFSFCPGLMEVTIPNSVTHIGESAFAECENLISVNIPNSVTSIGYQAFYHCSKLVNVNIPNSVTSLGGEAFCGCSSLKSISIPSSVTGIGWQTFCGCGQLRDLTIEHGITSIGYGAFDGCHSLKSINLPNSVTTIGPLAFEGCSGLTSIHIPKSLRIIGGGAFCYADATIYWNAQNCMFDNEDDEFCGPFNYCAVTHIVIGPEVTAIDDNIFYVSAYFDNWINYDNWGNWCDGNIIDTVTCYALIPPTITEECFYCDTYSNAVLEVPEGSLEAYRNAPGWKEFQNIVAIDDEVTTCDVNGDGNVTIDDLTALIDILLSDNTSGNEAADCNGDGNVTIDDVTTLIDYLLNGSW